MLNISARGAILLLFVGVLCVESVRAQGLKQGTYWIAYDVQTKRFKLCDRQITTSADMDHICRNWNPETNSKPGQFFHSGSLIRLEVLNGKFGSVFKMTTTGVTLQDVGAQVRGVPEATTPTTSKTGPPAPSPATKPGLTGDLVLQFEQQYGKTEEAIADAETELNPYFQKYVGPVPSRVEGNCSPRVMRLPPPRVGDILYFVNQLAADAAACDPNPDPYFRNEAAFYSLSDRADRLVQSITLFNASLPLLPSLTQANTEWNNYTTLMQSVTAGDAWQVESFLPNYSTNNNYTELNGRMKALVDRENLVTQEVAKINVSMTRAFNQINALYSISASPQPFDVPIGQYNSGFAGSIQISEVANVVLYTVTAAKAPGTTSRDNSQPPDSQSIDPQPANTPLDIPPPPPISPAPVPTATKDQNQIPILIPASYNVVEGASSEPSPPAPDKQKPPAQNNPQDSNPGRYVDTTNFEVHKMYRANLVAGFFASSLKNQPYGLTNNGQATSSTNITFVTVVGQPYSPQFHAYVGIDVYLWERDSSPDYMSKQKFLWLKKDHRWLNGYWNPNIMIGYGVDSLNNYLIGLNWEAKWGINFGGGLHIGQETRLQPGVIPGITQSPSTATSPLTYNKTAYGYYGNLGFDLNVMKAAIANLFGLGSGGTK
jgi:hypothetical protein